MKLILLLLWLPCFTHSLSFNFSRFDSSSQLDVEANASIVNDVIQLTANQVDTPLNGSEGRVSFPHALQLWRRSTTSSKHNLEQTVMADFSTRFSFVISDVNSSEEGDYSLHGDGLVFFLLPFNSTLLPGSGGGFLTLICSADALQSSFVVKPFVAVEFDTYSNAWDPEENHIGIDLYQVTSLATTELGKNGRFQSGVTEDVLITYNSTTKNLSVFAATAGSVPGSSFAKLMSQRTPNVSAIIDLSTVLPELVRDGFGASTGSTIEIHEILYWDFNSTSLVDNTQTRVFPWSRALVDAGLGAVALILFVLHLLRFMRGKPKFNPSDFRRRTWSREFTLQELKLATGNFDVQKKLGEGGFGTVFKGELQEDEDIIIQVAVKKLRQSPTYEIEKEFKSEVTTLGRLAHRNLVKLLGWCHEDQEWILVYEFMPNKTLHNHLHDDGQLLPWERRYQIAIDLASALTYLHQDCGLRECVLHRDIKSKNIMLDSDFTAKLGDFGLARFVNHGKSLVNTMMAGTPGYVDSECMNLAKVTKESDVYSFGIVLLEIVSGRNPELLIDPKYQCSLSDWVRNLHGEDKLVEAIDEALKDQFDMPQAHRLLLIGLWCCNPTPISRPSMERALECLKVRNNYDHMEDLVIENRRSSFPQSLPISQELQGK